LGVGAAEELCICWFGDGTIKTPGSNLRYPLAAPADLGFTRQPSRNFLFGASDDAVECRCGGFAGGRAAKT